MLSCMEMTTQRVSPRVAASRKYPLSLLCELAGAVLDSQTGELLEYLDLIKHPIYKEVWEGAFGKEVGRLTQGLPGVVEGTNTMKLIPKSDIPAERHKNTAYVRPEKEDPNRVRVTAAENQIKTLGTVGSQLRTYSLSSCC